MDTRQYENLKKNLITTKEEVAQNKGRFTQLKETAKAKFNVSSIKGLEKLKAEKEEYLDMQQTKKKRKMASLKELVPGEMLDEL